MIIIDLISFTLTNIKLTFRAQMELHAQIVFMADIFFHANETFQLRFPSSHTTLSENQMCIGRTDTHSSSIMSKTCSNSCA